MPRCCIKCYMFDECENKNECCAECDYFSDGTCLYAEEEDIVEEE